MYGSLIPFNIDWGVFQHSGGFGALAVGLRCATLEDAVTNVLVYVPVGVALVACGRSQALRRWIRIPFAVLVGAAVSLLAEAMQTAIAMRVACWVDVALNMIGTAAGAVLGAALYAPVSCALTRWKHQLAERPFATLASTLTIGLLLYELAPFDFVTSTAGLHASFRQANWNLAGTYATASSNPSVPSMAGQFTGAAWFAALGFLLVRGSLQAAHRRVVALATLVMHGVLLAGLIECMQLFTSSHHFDLSTLVLRMFAVTFGGWCAAFLIAGSTGPDLRRRPDPAISTELLAVLVMFQIGMIAMSSLDSALPSLRYMSPADVSWLPFEALWYRPTAQATGEVLSALSTYGTLALTVGLIVRRTRAKSIWLTTGLIVWSCALAAEVAQACTASRTADLTGPALAVVAVVGVSRLFDALRPFRPLETRVPDAQPPLHQPA